MGTTLQTALALPAPLLRWNRRIQNCLLRLFQARTRSAGDHEPHNLHVSPRLSWTSPLETRKKNLLRVNRTRKKNPLTVAETLTSLLGRVNTSNTMDSATSLC